MGTSWPMDTCRVTKEYVTTRHGYITCNNCACKSTGKAAILWRLSFRMGSFAKDCLQPFVNRISIKTWST